MAQEVNVKINNVEYSLPSGITVIQACGMVGVEIPRFCYHEKLKIAGNCRMCLVDIKPGPPKPQASCAINISPNMEITTDSQSVKNAREGVMEFLLANHPLDCPVCDQGGECDLQDQAYKYGKAASRFEQDKRLVDKKNFGPVVETCMTRCIHCTRCVRFMEDVAGTNEIGAFNRGNDVEISTYNEKGVVSELSGNIVDLCPVGALTSKQYLYQARPWELTRIESIDVMDGLGSAIQVNSFQDKVLRILPARNDDVNEEWISNKARHSCDGLYIQRIDKSYIRNDASLEPISTDNAISDLCEHLKGIHSSMVSFVAGGTLDMESLFYMKELSNHFASNQIAANVPQLHTQNISDYTLSSVNDVELADEILIIGSNVRKESPVLNSRIRRAYLENNARISYIGGEWDKNFSLNYPCNVLGETWDELSKIYDGSHSICERLEKAKRPLILVGYDAFEVDSKGVHSALLAIANKYCKRNEWNGFGIIHPDASSAAALYTGFNQFTTVDAIVERFAKGSTNIIFIVGEDNFSESQIDALKKARSATRKIVYIGTNGDKIAPIANLVLPACAYTEKDGYYMNLEGRIQRGVQAVPPLGESLPEYEIFKRILQQIGGTVNTFDVPFFDLPQKPELSKGEYKDFDITFNSEKKSFYLANSICRNSKFMADCELALLND